MNYLFFYYGTVPKYVEICFNNILNVDSDAKIYLMTNQNLKLNNVNILSMNDSSLNSQTEKFSSFFTDTNLTSNPLWATSLMRIYALKEIKEYYSLDEFVHFDTDVLIYKSFNEVAKIYKFDKNKISITPNDPRNLVFGYSYFPKSYLINQLIDQLNKNLEDYSLLKNIYNRGKDIPEMRHLGIIDDSDINIFSKLPTLPYNDERIIFDPAGYGQYLNGVHKNRGNYIFKRRWISQQHYVGAELKSKRIRFKFHNSPYVLYDKKKIELANLHIHSKKLSNFLKNKQKNYIN